LSHPDGLGTDGKDEKESARVEGSLLGGEAVGRFGD
jgi:hypothetical protein